MPSTFSERPAPKKSDQTAKRHVYRQGREKEAQLPDNMAAEQLEKAEGSSTNNEAPPDPILSNNERAAGAPPNSVAYAERDIPPLAALKSSTQKLSFCEEPRTFSSSKPTPARCKHV